MYFCAMKSEGRILALEHEKALLQEENKRLQEELQRKLERIDWLEKQLFGPKRDKRKYDDGPTLFDDEFNAAYDARQAELKKAADDVSATARKRRLSARKRSASSRPEKYLYCGLEERERIEMPEGINLDEYDKIGEDITRILHRDPAKVWVEVIRRPVLRRKSDRELPAPEILQAPCPSPVIGGNHVAADMLAQLAYDKFVSHIPEYRQVKAYADMGVTLPTSTINDWMHRMAAVLYPLYESQCELVRSSDYLQVDEVPWRIADSPGKTRKGYAWQFLDARPESRGLYFYYDKGSRGGAIARAQLRGYHGAVQTDGYGVYDYFEYQEDVILLGCMAHVRRKFIEAQDSHPLAATFVRHIATLYELEENLRHEHADADTVRRERQRLALPVLDGIEAMFARAALQCTPSDPLGKALDYANKLWPRMKRYVLDGRYQIDNNAVERGQRPSVMGRKNYLFSKNDRGAEDNAQFYTLLESCSIVGINHLRWLTYALERIRPGMDENQIVALLPYNCKTELR
jgi:transposase